MSICPSFWSIATEDSLKWTKRVVVVGCGIGGSLRYPAKKYGVQCQGTTLSLVQVQRAQALVVAKGLVDRFPSKL